MKRIPQTLMVFALILSLAGLLPGAASAWQSLDSASGPGPAQVDDPQVEPTGIPGLLKIFMPWLARPTFAISGQVTDSQGKPLPGVTLVDAAGQTATTDSSGRYTFSELSGSSYAIAPAKGGYVFSPALVSVASPSQGARQDFTALAADVELVANGGFETVYPTASDPWDLPATEHTAVYTTEGFHSGTRSVLTGITKAGQNTYSYSSARQLVSIPAGTTAATLTVWLYPYSTEAVSAPLPERPNAPLFETAALTSDAQYVLVLDANNNLLETLLWMRSNSQQWTLHTFNLTKYAGKSIKIHIGTFNDGFDGITATYVDDVSVQAATGGTTPPATPTPTTPPGTTPACGNLIANAGFEVSGSWNIPITEYPAAISTDRAYTGTRSMRTGIVAAGQNRYSYSDAFQTVTIPANAANPFLSLWLYPVTTEPLGSGLDSLSLARAPALHTAFNRDALTSDVQYVLILDAAGNVLDTPFWNLRNDGEWVYKQYSLKPYAGKTIRIQFGTYNTGGGGVSAMYVDEVLVDVCATAAATPTPIPTPIPGPTATPNPALCAEKLGNNSFEDSTAWEIPITAFSAGYSADLAHSGLRSMRAGITAKAHNRFSYSDFRQVVSLPRNLSSASLTMWLSAATGEATALSAPERPTANLKAEAASAGDVQYLLILDAFGNWIDTLVWQRQNVPTWTAKTFDLSAYAGETIQLQFGVYNDGLDGVTSMYVDDVSLQVCP